MTSDRVKTIVVFKSYLSDLSPQLQVLTTLSILSVSQCQSVSQPACQCLSVSVNPPIVVCQSASPRLSVSQLVNKYSIQLVSERRAHLPLSTQHLSCFCHGDRYVIPPRGHTGDVSPGIQNKVIPQLGRALSPSFSAWLPAARLSGCDPKAS